LSRACSALTATVIIGALMAGCAREATPTDGLPRSWGETLSLDGDRLQVQILCYKAVTLAQQRYSGLGEKTGVIGKGLEGVRSTLEDRVVSDFSRGDEKMRLNAGAEARIQKLLREQPYGSSEILLNTAYACADLERRDAWRDMTPHR
jgi:hypothetical protein